MKRKFSHSGYEDSNEAPNDDFNMMQFDDDIIDERSNMKSKIASNQSMQIQTSFLANGINTPIETESIKKKSIGIDVSKIKNNNFKLLFLTKL